MPRERMMPLLLRERETSQPELMDLPDCDEQKLHKTYEQFRFINRGLSGWKKIFIREIEPLCEVNKTLTILDIGFGGGDIPLYLAELARNRKKKIHIHGIETDSRAIDYVNKLPADPMVKFSKMSLEEVFESGEKYDVIISNHLIHHLDPLEIDNIIKLSHSVAEKKIIFNDLRRSNVSWLLFNSLTLFFFHNSFIRYDGLLSIRKSFTDKELKGMLPTDWTVKKLAPFRILMVKEFD